MKNSILLVLLSIYTIASSQQIADKNYNPVIDNPVYESGKGPVVYIDQGHHNFHTKNGRYKAFATLLERDGYRVQKYQGKFRMKQLNEGRILVISNALNKMNVRHWYLPTPSAFTDEEIKIVEEWVNSGGSLFLIADHMPMGGAAADLASVFGFGFTNGFAMDTANKRYDVFELDSNTLIESKITRGRNASETVSRIVSFTGQAFTIPEDATPILTFPDQFVSFLPDTAWNFNEDTKTVNIGGWHQGAYKSFGKGKVVVFGEAAMFTAQLAGPNQIKAGMNNEVADENYLLLLNIIHWLDGKLE